MYKDKTRGSKGNLDYIVIGLREVTKDLVGSYKNWLEFIKLSLFKETGERNPNHSTHLVLRRETVVFVALFGNGCLTINKLSHDSIPKSIKYSIRFERESRDNNSFFELE